MTESYSLPEYSIQTVKKESSKNNFDEKQKDIWENLVIGSALLLSICCWFNERFLPISINLNLATLILVSQKNRDYFQTKENDFKTNKLKLNSFHEQLAIQSIQTSKSEDNYQQLALKITDQERTHKQITESILKDLSALNIQTKKYISKSHLNILTNGIREIKRKHKQLELGKINRVDLAISEVQEQISDLAHKISLLSAPNAVSIPEQENVEPVDDIAIFIDGSNLYYTLKKLKLKIDFTKFLNLLKGRTKNYQVYYYVGVDDKDQSQLGFLNYLQQVGYEVVSKRIVRRRDGSCKANLDVELAIDMLAKVDTFKTAILVSGDGDFSYALKTIQKQGKRVEVFSFPDDTSKSLCKTADEYHNLHDVFSKIERT